MKISYITAVLVLLLPSCLWAKDSVLVIPSVPQGESKSIARIEWLGKEIPYPEAEKKGDLFPVTWADDDNQYSSSGDPCWGAKTEGLDFLKISGMAPDHKITRVNNMEGYLGYGALGPKATGIISVKGVLYLAFNGMTHNPPNKSAYETGYDSQIISSTDHGRTWKPDISTLKEPMFPGVLFGAPTFVNYGRDNAGARDGYVYAISGGTYSNGEIAKLGRVPSDRIMQREAWEWVSGLESDYKPKWSKDPIEAVPVLTHPGYISGYLDMVFVPGLNRYLVLSWRYNVKHSPDHGSELIIYDAPEPWGPFTVAYHEDPWESKEMSPYCPRIPLKWYSPEKMEGWMLFSGSFRENGSTPYYRSHVRKFRIVLR